MSLALARRRNTDDGVELPPDAALLDALTAQDKAALGDLYDRYHRDVYRFIARVANTTGPELDDLTQSTFLEACRSAHRFRGKSSVKTWLFGIGANLTRRHLRREGRRQNALGSLELMPAPYREAPDALAERSELMRKLETAIAALPRSLREAYVLCVIEEVSGAEAARALGIRESSLWRRLHDARKALRRQLDGGEW
jgi:RNA polymerase sigma-70 factor (ECF subfamily)